MSFKDVLISKIANEKKANKRVAKGLNKKAAWSDAEKKQVGALDDNAVGKYNIYQNKGGEIIITNKKLNDNYALMDTADDIDTVLEKVERDWQEYVNFVGFDKAIAKEVWFLKDKEDSNEIVDLTKDYATEKKAAEEDLDVKLKVQKNKPAGLDTSSPKSLPESIRPLMQDLKGKMATLKETEAELADVKAGLDAKYQKAKDESKIVEKQAEIENLTNSIGKLLFAAKNETFQFQDNLVALTHQTKVVPAKATDKWKFEKVFEKLKSLMGDENAQKFLDATLNGLQSQATEKTITELNIFSPTQKQMKQSDTSDTNKFIDALKEIYVNLRSYFLDVKKANNIIEEQLATGATASKKQVVTKKAEYKAEEDVLFEMMEDFEIFTPGEIEVGITVGGRNLETAEAMLFSRTGLRNLTQLKDDLRNGGTDQETLDSYMVGDIEDTEIESKKKVNLKKAKKVNKKAKMHKKAAVQLNLEIDDYIELLKDRYESAPADWKTRGGRLLINELYEFMENYDGGKVEIPSIVIDNFLINGDIVERTEFTADGQSSHLFEKYNGNWEEFCEEEAVIYNDNAACTNLGF